MKVWFTNFGLCRRGLPVLIRGTVINHPPLRSSDCANAAREQFVASQVQKAQKQIRLEED